MNKPVRPSEMQTPEVTTGPIIGSHKVYSSPPGHPDVAVPMREIPLHETANEPPVRVYDPSGPYTDASA
ncbi:MAG: phosphomethylpyrimidine synthase, partial [Pseudomonadota bacterium]